MSENAAIDLDKALVNYGLDSVLSVKLVQDLGNWLGYDLEVTIIWNFPSINLLIDHLLNPQALQTPTADKMTPLSQQDLDQLSESEAEEMLLKTLEELDY